MSKAVVFKGDDRDPTKQKVRVRIIVWDHIQTYLKNTIEYIYLFFCKCNELRIICWCTNLRLSLFLGWVHEKMNTQKIGSLLKKSLNTTGLRGLFGTGQLQQTGLLLCLSLCVDWQGCCPISRLRTPAPSNQGGLRSSQRTGSPPPGPAANQTPLPGSLSQS